MNVLITSATSALAKLVHDGLVGTHRVRLTDRKVSTSDSGVALAYLGSDPSTNLLVGGMDAIVHVAETLDGEDAIAYLDSTTQATYNLLLAAHQEGVHRVVLLSTLALMANYDEAEQVTERWRPRAKPAFPELGKLMAESVCREFAREHKLEVVVLRLGSVEPLASAGNAMWLSVGDLQRAVAAALDAVVPVWSVFHVQSQFPGARFACEDAERVLGYRHDPVESDLSTAEGAR